MEDSVTQRVRDFLENIHLTVNGLSKVINIGQPTLSKQMKEGGCGVSLTTIVLLLQVYPDLSAEWLLRGEGEMMKKGVRQADNTYVRHLESEVEYLREQNMLLLGGNYKKEKVAG